MTRLPTQSARRASSPLGGESLRALRIDAVGWPVDDGERVREGIVVLSNAAVETQYVDLLALGVRELVDVPAAAASQTARAPARSASRTPSSCSV